MGHPIGLCLHFRQVRTVAQESKTYRRFSTRIESASRKLGDAWGSAKGLKTNLAKAEGLQLPSP